MTNINGYVIITHGIKRKYLFTEIYIITAIGVCIHEKTKKTVLTAAILAAAMNLAACENDSSEKNNPDSDVLVTKEYRPEDDEIYDVYGPPIAYEDEQSH